MRHQTIEERFRAVSSGHRNGAVHPSIDLGVSSSSDSFTASFSQAAQEITQLRNAYQTQSQMLSANTEALQKSGTSGQGTGGGVGSAIEGIAQKIFGGGVLFSLFQGISGLFGGGSSTPAPLPVYEPPPPVSIDSTLRESSRGSAGALYSAGLLPALQSSAGGNSFGGTVDSGSRASGVGNTSEMGGEGSAKTAAKNVSFSPQVTVNVNAMDSQSIVDRSSDIAEAVRQAVLNLHPLTNVLADL